MEVNRANMHDLEYREYRKLGTTKLAGPFDPPVTVETVTGPHEVRDHRVYIAIDAAGHPYPVEEEIVATSYVAEDETTVPGYDDISRHRVEVYQGEDGDWWWRRFAANGEQVSRSEEGYTDSSYTRHRATMLNPGVEVEVLQPETEIEQTHPLPGAIQHGEATNEPREGIEVPADGSEHELQSDA